eukprot:2039715-Pyramimonas_sp.AAC.1
MMRWMQVTLSSRPRPRVATGLETAATSRRRTVAMRWAKRGSRGNCRNRVLDARASPACRLPGAIRRGAQRRLED